MNARLTPRRRRGAEYLDAPDIDARTVTRSLADVARSNALFGGTSAVLAELSRIVAELPGKCATLLDVGTGLGDIPARARDAWASRGSTLTIFGVDGNEALARSALSLGMPTVRAHALQLPFRDASVDIAMCSQVLHHFEGDGAIALLRELDRVAKRRVIVSDLRRSWIAAAGLWLASFPLGFHPVSRHDGVVSVLRGFTSTELRDLVRQAVGAEAEVHDRPAFRATASWAPTRMS
ncbi:MAG TPA: methyltransferase domain-containing protein [Gemmatimonadaceae bacterium]|nr:methyltransferase domain-containing protein [Gemmatimonadaceae bacterium]